MENTATNREEIIERATKLMEAWQAREQGKANKTYPEGIPTMRMVVKERYVAVYRKSWASESISFFVDITGGKIGKHPSKSGDILKPAGCKAPAPHARGSVFESDYGLSKLGDYGPAYLR